MLEFDWLETKSSNNREDRHSYGSTWIINQNEIKLLMLVDFKMPIGVKWESKRCPGFVYVICHQWHSKMSKKIWFKVFTWNQFVYVSVYCIWYPVKVTALCLFGKKLSQLQSSLVILFFNLCIYQMNYYDIPLAPAKQNYVIARVYNKLWNFSECWEF